MKPGDHVTWYHTPKGGYGYVFKIPAKVIKVNKKTIRIEIKKNDGTLVQRNVKPENLK